MSRWVNLTVILLLSVGLIGVMRLGVTGPMRGTGYPELSNLITEIQEQGVSPQLGARLEQTAMAMGAPGLFLVDSTNGTSPDTGPIVSAYPSSAVGEPRTAAALRKVRAASVVNRLSNLDGGTVARLEPTPGQRYSLVLVTRRSPVIKAAQAVLLAGLGISLIWLLRRHVQRPA